MNPSAVTFEGVWKKFRRGERHNSLRDLIPAAVSRLAGRGPGSDLKREEFWALRDVSFEVAPGHALGIIGPNGAGKSTTLKLLSRILKPTRGRCEVRGRAAALIEVAAGFHPDLTGRENIYLQGAIMGMKRAEIARELESIVEFAGVRDHIDTPVKRYSSGMNARLGFAIAAHLNPDVLVIDEVLSVGDMEFQQRCVERMLEVKRNGAAVVFVSHNLSAVRVMCDDALLLHKGRTVAHGPTAATLAAYVEGSFRRLPDDGAETVRRFSDATVVSLTLPEGREVTTLRPRDALTVRLRISTPYPASALVLVTHVVQQETDVTAYDGHTSLSTLKASSDETTFEIQVSLRANLLRGVYSLNFSVYHPATSHHLLWLRPAAIFGIDESTSYAGVADLEVQVVTSQDLEPLSASAVERQHR